MVQYVAWDYNEKWGFSPFYWKSVWLWLDLNECPYAQAADGSRETLCINAASDRSIEPISSHSLIFWLSMWSMATLQTSDLIIFNDRESCLPQCVRGTVSNICWYVSSVLSTLACVFQAFLSSFISEVDAAVFCVLSEYCILAHVPFMWGTFSTPTWDQPETDQIEIKPFHIPQEVSEAAGLKQQCDWNSWPTWQNVSLIRA